MEKSVKVLTGCSLRSWGRLKKATGSGQGVGSGPLPGAWVGSVEAQASRIWQKLCHKKDWQLPLPVSGCSWHPEPPEPLCKKSDSPAGEALKKRP